MLSYPNFAIRTKHKSPNRKANDPERNSALSINFSVLMEYRRRCTRVCKSFSPNVYSLDEQRLVAHFKVMIGNAVKAIKTDVDIEMGTKERRLNLKLNSEAEMLESSNCKPARMKKDEKANKIVKLAEEVSRK